MRMDDLHLRTHPVVGQGERLIGRTVTSTT